MSSQIDFGVGLSNRSIDGSGDGVDSVRFCVVSAGGVFKSVPRIILFKVGFSVWFSDISSAESETVFGKLSSCLLSFSRNGFGSVW